MSDVVVVGGGVIGLSIAYELAGQGVAVRLLDQAALGQEASWAGAGMLPPGNPDSADSSIARLRAESHRLWPKWTAQLRDETGIDNGFRQTGAIRVSLNQSLEQLQNEITALRREGVEVEELAREVLYDYEPALNPRLSAAYRVPKLCQVRNPRHLKALIAGCASRGVDLRTGCPVVGFDKEQGRVEAAVTATGERHAASQFVVAGGAWSKPLLAAVGCDLSVEPVRGQIVLLACQPLPFRHVLEIGPRYLVPRPDGRILIGSTEEWAGFDKRNTPRGIAGLLQLAGEIVPALAEAKFERAWSGLRPHSPDGLPYLGQLPETENLFVAAGHFRAGLQLSPITGLLMRQLLLEQEPLVPLEAFRCDRHRQETVESNSSSSEERPS